MISFNTNIKNIIFNFSVERDYFCGVSILKNHLKAHRHFLLYIKISHYFFLPFF